MIDTLLRPKLDASLFQPLVKCLIKCRITPNQVTLFSLVTGLLVLPLLYCDWALLAVASLWLSGLGDVLDGGLARESDTTSDAGTIFDIISDRCVEFAVILALYLVDPERAFLALMMLGSVLICVTTFLVIGIIAEKSGPKSFYYSPGLMERAEAFVMFSLMMFFPEWFLVLGWAFVCLVGLTVAMHLKKTTKGT